MSECKLVSFASLPATSALLNTEQAPPGPQLGPAGHQPAAKEPVLSPCRQLARQLVSHVQQTSQKALPC